MLLMEKDILKTFSEFFTKNLLLGSKPKLEETIEMVEKERNALRRLYLSGPHPEAKFNGNEQRQFTYRLGKRTKYLLKK